MQAPESLSWRLRRWSYWSFRVSSSKTKCDYQIIREYEKLTGLPSIVNTSFNVHDEPIVCSPGDALNGFIDGDLDYMTIGGFLVEGVNAQNRERVITSMAKAV